MWVECECGKTIGKVIFSWSDAPEFEIYDNGMKLFPEMTICEECLAKIDEQLVDFVRKGKVLDG